MTQTNRISLKNQIRLLNLHYPEGSIKLIKNKGFIWLGNLKSSPIGDTYNVKIVFEISKKPNVYVIDPQKLKFPEGKSRLPHVYDSENQRLCLFYPDGREWNETKMVASTILPWTIEWLYHYEHWLITGQWLGGGKHPSNNKKH